MATWQVHKAKARFSELLEQAARGAADHRKARYGACRRAVDR